MKKILFLSVFMVFASMIFAQDFKYESGKCYEQCIVPEEWETRYDTTVIMPEYKTIVTHPAEYKTETRRVMVKEASHYLEIVPAEYATRTMTYTEKEDGNELAIVDATFLDNAKEIVAKPAYWVYENKIDLANCKSANPADCVQRCVKEMPAIKRTIPYKTLGVDAHTVSSVVPGNENTYEVTYMSKAPTTREVEIPAEYADIQETKLVKEAWFEEVVVPEVIEVNEYQVLVSEAKVTGWKEIECETKEYSPLPINWNLNSSTLTRQAKGIIDQYLVPILEDGYSVEIASHTDCRGNDDYNQRLSQSRADAVSAYLVKKGFSKDQMVSKGYGETKLLNKCEDGVSCTEAEHRVNRRTEFKMVK